MSIDGSAATHDRIRGKGAYNRLLESLKLLHSTEIPLILSMSVTRENCSEMSEVVAVASRFGISTVHFMWLFARGRAESDRLPDLSHLKSSLAAAYTTAREKNITIDNIEAIRSQVFTIPGTRFDLSNSGWESMAIRPDRRSSDFLRCRQVNLRTVWKRSGGKASF